MPPASRSPSNRTSAARDHPSAVCPPCAVEVPDLHAADLLLRELGELDAREAVLQAECDQQIAAAREKFAAQLSLDIAGARVSFAERRKAILKGLESYADGHREELLANGGDKKSRELNHGTLGWRKSPPALTPAKRGFAKGDPKLLNQALAFIGERIEKLKFFAAGTMRFLRVRLEWDKDALKQAVLEKEIDRAELRQAGFLLDDGEENFFAEPHSQHLESL